MKNMNKIVKILIIISVLFLFIGAVSASDTSTITKEKCKVKTKNSVDKPVKVKCKVKASSTQSKKNYPHIYIKLYKSKSKDFPNLKFIKKGAKEGDGYILIGGYSKKGVYSPRGAYVFSSRLWDDGGPLHVKILSSKFFFKNNRNGKYIVRWDTKPYQEYSPIYGYLVGSTVNTPLIKGYTPFYAKVWYKLV